MHDFFSPYFSNIFSKEEDEEEENNLALEHNFQQKILCTQNNIAFERQIKKAKVLVAKHIPIFYCEILLWYNIPLNFLF
jgi:hypothetical protein